MIAYAFLMAVYIGVAVWQGSYGWAAAAFALMVGLMLTAIIELQHEIIDALRKK
jgi:membrane associated rhomboid family serine protease